MNPSPLSVQVCAGKSCSERHSSYIHLRIEREIAAGKLDWVTLSSCLCQGKCQESPTVVIDGTHLTRMNPVTAVEAIRARMSKAKSVFSPPPPWPSAAS